MNRPELKALTDWCDARSLRWLPTSRADSAVAMVLEPRDASRPWQRMTLILGDCEFCLEDETGDTLATASDLPALLDAVDGGVADLRDVSAGERSRLLA